MESEKYHLDQGFNFLDQNEYGRALTEFYRVLDLAPHHIWAHIYVANVLRLQHRIDDASSEYQRAAELAPDDADVHWIVADFYESIGENDKAIAEYSKVLHIAPSVDGYVTLGNLLLETGDKTKANEMYNSAIKLDPANSNIKSYIVANRE